MNWQLVGERHGAGAPGECALLVRLLGPGQHDVFALLAIAVDRLDMGPLDRCFRRRLRGRQAQRLRLGDRRKQTFCGQQTDRCAEMSSSARRLQVLFAVASVKMQVTDFAVFATTRRRLGCHKDPEHQPTGTFRNPELAVRRRKTRVRHFPVDEVPVRVFREDLNLVAPIRLRKIAVVRALVSAGCPSLGLVVRRGLLVLPTSLG